MDIKEKGQSVMETQFQPTQSTPTYATYNDFLVTKLGGNVFEQKVIPGTGPTANPPSPAQPYWQIPLIYNYGSDDDKRLSEFLFEGCELETRYGLQSKAGASGRVDYSIMCSFDNGNQEHQKCLEAFKQIHEGCATILALQKGGVKMHHFNAKSAEATGLKSPVYYTRDDTTGEIIPGRPPRMYFKMFKRGKDHLEEKTLFTDIKGNQIPWELLDGVEMKFIPLLHIKRIFIVGGKASIQMEMQSAIVTSIRARNTTTRQANTLTNLQKSRPELADMVADQIAKITTARQDKLLAAQESTTQKGDAPKENQPQTTFSGVSPLNRAPITGAVPPSPAFHTQTIPELTNLAPHRGGLPIIPTIMPGIPEGSAQSPTTFKYT